MSLLIKKYKKGYRFTCPISNKFYGPFFKTKESIEDFFSWYDGDIRYIGTWVSNSEKWQDVILNWTNYSENKFKNDVILEKKDITVNLDFSQKEDVIVI